MDDYLATYVTPAGFDVPRLINDDFWVAIKLLFNARCYVSASKLILSFVDSIAFVESGESGGPAFQRWLNTYVDLPSIGVTAEELWEHRNSLLHMTNLDSRKVVAGTARRLIAYVGHLPLGAPTGDPTSGWFSLPDLMQAIVKGCSRFLETLQREPGRIEAFVLRYDLIVSDVRLERFVLEDAG